MSGSATATLDEAATVPVQVSAAPIAPSSAGEERLVVQTGPLQASDAGNQTAYFGEVALITPQPSAGGASGEPVPIGQFTFFGAQPGSGKDVVFDLSAGEPLPPEALAALREGKARIEVRLRPMTPTPDASARLTVEGAFYSR